MRERCCSGPRRLSDTYTLRIGEARDLGGSGVFYLLRGVELWVSAYLPYVSAGGIPAAPAAIAEAPLAAAVTDLQAVVSAPAGDQPARLEVAGATGSRPERTLPSATPRSTITGRPTGSYRRWP